jgi:membrane protease YdiL (CAAX protease family)
MFDPDSVGSPGSVSVRPPRTWDFMETLFVALLADAVYYVTATLALLVMLRMQENAGSLSRAQLHALWTQGNWYGVALVVGCLSAIVVVGIAVRMAGRDFAEYLALNWPNAAELAYAAAIMTFLVVVEDVARSYVGGTPWKPDFLVVKDAGGLLILLVGGCIVGPIAEEFVVRGLMFRGWSESFVGPIGAVVLTSALWALNHTQYGWFDRFCIFLMGLALGYFRWRSNSTWLTVIVHSAIDIQALFLAGRYT